MIRIKKSEVTDEIDEQGQEPESVYFLWESDVMRFPCSCVLGIFREARAARRFADNYVEGGEIAWLDDDDVDSNGEPYAGGAAIGMRVGTERTYAIVEMPLQ